MPIKILSRSPHSPNKRQGDNGVASDRWKPALTGTLVVVAVVAIGRHFVGITSTTLSGWTALFFVGVFTGLLTANSVSRRRFVSPLQKAVIACGTISSLTTLFLLQVSSESFGAAGLSISCVIFVLTMSMGFKHRSPKTTSFSDKSLAHWAVRLDDLLKYDLDRALKGQVVALIEALWHSPRDLETFVPSQNQSFEDILDSLEQSIRAQDPVLIERNLTALNHCLNERNQLIHNAISVSYRVLESNSAMLPKASDNNISILSQK